MYVLVRVDKRFWVPNGSRGAGAYSGAMKMGDLKEKPQPDDDNFSIVDSLPPARPRPRPNSVLSLRRASVRRSLAASPTSWILSEEEAFDDMVESAVGFVPRRQTSFRAKETWFESRETMVEPNPPDVPDVGKAI